MLYFGFAAISLMALRNAIFMGLVGPVLMAAYFPKWRAIPAAAALLAAAVLIGYDVAPAVANGNVFALRAAEWQLPSGAADFASYRITRQTAAGRETILVPFNAVPNVVKQSVTDNLK